MNFQVFKHNNAVGFFFALYFSCMFLVYKSVSVSPEDFHFRMVQNSKMQNTVNNISVKGPQNTLICFWSESETQSDLKSESRSKRPWLWKTLNVKRSVCSQMLFEVT